MMSDIVITCIRLIDVMRLIEMLRLIEMTKLIKMIRLIEVREDEIFNCKSELIHSELQSDD